MGKIATWSFLNSKFGTSGSPTNKCPRKSDIEATGKVKVSGSYSSNQLVQETNCYVNTIQFSIYDATYNGGINSCGATYKLNSVYYNIDGTINFIEPGSIITNVWVDIYNSGNTEFRFQIQLGSYNSYIYTLSNNGDETRAILNCSYQCTTDTTANIVEL